MPKVVIRAVRKNPKLSSGYFFSAENVSLGLLHEITRPKFEDYNNLVEVGLIPDTDLEFHRRVVQPLNEEGLVYCEENL
jgi:hypothetical protein